MSAADYLVNIIDDCTRVDSSELVTTAVKHAGVDGTLVDWLLKVRPRR